MMHMHRIMLRFYLSHFLLHVLLSVSAYLVNREPTQLPRGRRYREGYPHVHPPPPIIE
jgi:hypothetical protein